MTSSDTNKLSGDSQEFNSWAVACLDTCCTSASLHAPPQCVGCKIYWAKWFTPRENWWKSERIYALLLRVGLRPQRDRFTQMRGRNIRVTDCSCVSDVTTRLRAARRVTRSQTGKSKFWQKFDQTSVVAVISVFLPTTASLAVASSCLKLLLDPTTAREPRKHFKANLICWAHKILIPKKFRDM